MYVADGIRFLFGRLGSCKILITDPDLVERPARTDIIIYEVPATAIAVDLGCGLLQYGHTGFPASLAPNCISEENLLRTIADNVPAKFFEINKTAALKGWTSPVNKIFRWICEMRLLEWQAKRLFKQFGIPVS